MVKGEKKRGRGLKRRRMIAKTSKQTIQPSLAEDEKERREGESERDERRRDERKKRREGEERNKCKKNKRWREEGKKREGKTCPAGGVVCVLPDITGCTWGLAGAAPYYWYWHRHSRRKWRDLRVLLPEAQGVLRDRRFASCDYLPEVSNNMPYSRLPKMDISPALDLPSPCPPLSLPLPLSLPDQLIILFYSMHIFRGNP